MIGRAFRSCCPDLDLRFRKSSAAHLVENELFDDPGADEPELEFQDVEQFLTEHGHDPDAIPPHDELFHEQDVAEVLSSFLEGKACRNQSIAKSEKVSAGQRDEAPVPCGGRRDQTTLQMLLLSQAGTLGP